MSRLADQLLILTTIAGVLGMGGCFGMDPADDESPSEPERTVALRGCTGAELVVGARSDWAASQLPANETLAPNPQSGGLLVNTLLIFLDCEEHELGAESMGPVRLMSYAIGVEPVEDPRIFHIYLRDLIIDGSPDLAAYWQRSSEQIREGTVTIDDDGDGVVELYASSGPDEFSAVSVRVGSHEGGNWPIDRIWHHDDGTWWHLNGTKQQGGQTVYFLQATGYLEGASAPLQGLYATWISVDAPYERFAP